MYRQFYHLSRDPFSKTLPPHDAYITHDFREMSNRLDFLMRQGGIGMFCAASGFGKTFGMRAWSSRLNTNVQKCAYICLSTVSALEFYRKLSVALGIEPGYKKSDMFKTVQEHLYYEAVERKVKSAIIIDEAQYLSEAILRDLKMITNFDMDSRDCVSVVLSGQTTLADKLSRNLHEALRQRIVVNYTFEGLSEDESASYIDSMLEQAGGTGTILDPAAKAAAYGACQGSIRRLNSILTNALRIGAQQQSLSVNADMVYAAVEETALR